MIDRCVFLHLLVITEKSRRIEKEFFKAFHAEYPQLLGSLLDAVAGGLRELRNVHLTSTPRMADFAVFGEAVCRGLGHEAGKFIDAYCSNRKAANESALEDSYVAAAIRELVAKVKWTGTSSELKDELELIVNKKVIDSHRWPKSPRGMSGVLRRLAPSLRLVGVNVEFADPKNKLRTITIHPVDNWADQSPTPPTPPTSDASTNHSGSCNSGGLRAVGDRPTSTAQQPPDQPPESQGITENRDTASVGGLGGSGGQNPTLSPEHAVKAREVFEL